MSLALVVAAAAALALFVAMGALLWWRQERIVFQPPRGPWPEGDGARRVDYTASDGQRLFGFVVGEPAPGRRLLIVFHGNADLAGWWVPWAREAHRRTGHAILLAEYRGYAGLDGEPTYERSARDAHAAWEAATRTDVTRGDATRGDATRGLGVRSEDVSLMGHSLGSAIAAELARRLQEDGHPPRALLLQSPFTSARGMARIIVSRPMMLLWDVIARVHFDTETKVRELAVPVHVAHGQRDLLIPLHMGRAVHAAARVPGELLVVPAAGHNDVDDVGGDAYWRWLERALGHAERAAAAEAGQPAPPARP